MLKLSYMNEVFHHVRLGTQLQGAAEELSKLVEYSGHLHYV
jgi:hypothetical protein